MPNLTKKVRQTYQNGKFLKSRFGFLFFDFSGKEAGMKGKRFDKRVWRSLPKLKMIMTKK